MWSMLSGLIGRVGSPYLIASLLVATSGAGLWIYEKGKDACLEELARKQALFDEEMAKMQNERSRRDVEFAAEATRVYTEVEASAEKLSKVVESKGGCTISADSARLLDYYVEASKPPTD